MEQPDKIMYLQDRLQDLKEKAAIVRMIIDIHEDTIGRWVDGYEYVSNKDMMGRVRDYVNIFKKEEDDVKLELLNLSTPPQEKAKVSET